MLEGAHSARGKDGGTSNDPTTAEGIVGIETDAPTALNVANSDVDGLALNHNKPGRCRSIRHHTHGPITGNVKIGEKINEYRSKAWPHTNRRGR
jgi:hypothetical protein